MIALLVACVGGPPAVEPEDFGAAPTFSLTDQSGRTVTTGDFAGKVWVANFIFTSCPDVCPTLSAHMAEVQTHYRAEPRLHLVSFTVDPATDTPPVLAAYGARFGADANRWSFLTGDTEAVTRVVVDGFKQMIERGGATGDPATILHGSRFVVVDGKGRMRAFAEPTEPEKRSLYAAVDQSLAGL